MRTPMTAGTLRQTQQWSRQTPARKGVVVAGAHAAACSTQWVRNTAQSTSGRSSSHRTARPLRALCPGTDRQEQDEHHCAID